MTAPADEIDDINALNSTMILNKCAAIVNCGESTLTNLAAYLGKPLSRISEWVSQRKYRPDADTLFKMRSWASGATLSIALGTRKRQSDYRAAYTAICRKFPVNGREA